MNISSVRIACCLLLIALLAPQSFPTAYASPLKPPSSAPDTDNHGVPDEQELPGDTDGDGTPNISDPDDDGDGVSTSIEIPGGTAKSAAVSRVSPVAPASLLVPPVTGVSYETVHNIPTAPCSPTRVRVQPRTTAFATTQQLPEDLA